MVKTLRENGGCFLWHILRANAGLFLLPFLLQNANLFLEKAYLQSTSNLTDTALTGHGIYQIFHQNSSQPNTGQDVYYQVLTANATIYFLIFEETKEG